MINRSFPGSRTHGAGWLQFVMTFLQGCIFVVLMGVILWLLASFPVWWTSAPRIPLPMSVAINPAVDPVSLISGSTELRSVEMGTISGDIKVAFDNAWTQWLFLFFLAQEIVLVYLIVSMLRKIVASISHGDAFSSLNAKRLRWVGFLFIVEAIYAPGISTALSKWVINDLIVSGGTLMIDWSSVVVKNSFITGWVLLILSEVFRQGSEMHEEQSLTV